MFLHIAAATLIKPYSAALLHSVPLLCTASVTGGLNARWCKPAFPLGRCSEEEQLPARALSSNSMANGPLACSSRVTGWVFSTTEQEEQDRILAHGLALSKAKDHLVFYLWWRKVRVLRQSFLFLFFPLSLVYIYLLLPTPFLFKERQKLPYGLSNL